MISFDEFLKQDECDKYNMLQECNAIIQQKENIIKEVREKVSTIYFEVKSNNSKYNNLYLKLKDTLQGQELLEILDKGNNND